MSDDSDEIFVPRSPGFVVMWEPDASDRYAPRLREIAKLREEGETARTAYLMMKCTKLLEKHAVIMEHFR